MSENERVLWHQLAEFAERLRLSEIEHDRIYSELKEQIECLEYDLGQAEGRKRDAEEYWRTARETLQSHIDKEIELTKEVVMLKNHNKELMRENAKLRELVNDQSITLVRMKDIKDENNYLMDKITDYEKGPKQYLKDILNNISLSGVSDEMLKGFNECKDLIDIMMYDVNSDEDLARKAQNSKWHDAEKCLPLLNKKVTVAIEKDGGKIFVIKNAKMVTSSHNLHYWINLDDDNCRVFSYKTLKWRYADE